MKNSALYNMVTSKYTRKFLIALYIEAHICVTIHLGKQGYISTYYRRVRQKGSELNWKLSYLQKGLTEKEPSMPEMY